MKSVNVVKGPVIFVGYGSIGRGVLALFEKHFSFQENQITIIEPKLSQLDYGTGHKYSHLHLGLKPSNYEDVLDSIIQQSAEQAIIINLSVEVSSVSLMRYANKRNALYIDTVVEPWPGVYDDFNRPAHERTNYHLRKEVLSLRTELSASGPTAVSCCGANPGMVSWLVKRALLQIARDTNTVTEIPKTRGEWSNLAQKLGVVGIHIAERDDQTTMTTVPETKFVNTWSVEGLISEALQPAELGWGTHEQELPIGAEHHEDPQACGIFLDSVGAKTKVRTWVPTHGEVEAYLVTHNEALSLSDYLTVRDESGKVIYRPTVHYAYRPCDATVEALNRLTSKGITSFDTFTVLTEGEISDGFDELGVLLFGHNKNAYWYGSKLSTEEAKALAPHQNATGLQVTSAVIAGIHWMLENPHCGIVEVEEMDHEFCLAIQEPYLGKVFGAYTDWKPTNDKTDPWQFSNIMLSQ
ncbi:MAG: hypothetical protein RLZZ360_11 [Candidatus Parcubacteria bacterium]|jgi:homospermidine synthase